MAGPNCFLSVHPFWVCKGVVIISPQFPPDLFSYVKMSDDCWALILTLGAAEIVLEAYQVQQVLMYYSSRGRGRMKRFWSLVWRLPFYWLHSGLSSRQYEAKRFISSVTFINFRAGINLMHFYFCDNCKDTLWILELNHTSQFRQVNGLEYDSFCAMILYAIGWQEAGMEVISTCRLSN